MHTQRGTDGGGFDPDSLTLTDWRRWHASLRYLRRHRLGYAAARAFEWVWLRCRGQVTEGVRFSLDDWAEYFGREVRSAEGWIEHLRAAELIFVRSIDGDRNVVCDVYSPNPEVPRKPRAEWLQERFAFDDRESDCVTDRSCAGAQEPPRKPPGVTAGVTAQKPPRKPPQEPPEAAIARIDRETADGKWSMGEGLRQKQVVWGYRRRPPPKPPPPAAPDIRYRNLKETGDLDIDILNQSALETEIHKRAGDVELRASPVSKVAEALIEGRVEWKDVVRAINLARQKTASGDSPHVWVYLVGAWQKMFKERGLQWDRRKRKQPQPT